jgi:ankyrin repeat protein
MALARPRSLVALLLSVTLFAACGRTPSRRPTGEVQISYEFHAGDLAPGPDFRVRFQDDGLVVFRGIRGCAVPGEQRLSIPTREFARLRRAVDEADFFAIPRLDPSPRGCMDCGVITVTYRDRRRIHETVDSVRNLPRLTRFEERLREAAHVVDGFINPSLDVYERVVRDGWNINAVDAEGENALTAALGMNREAALFLLEHGAEASRHALCLAAWGDAETFWKVAKSRRLDLGSGEARALLVEAAGRRTSVTRSLLAAGMDPNGVSDGRWPLEAALGSRERVEALLAAGADPRLAKGVMFAAVRQNDSGMITLMARHGADVNAREQWTGRTPLLLASDGCQYWHIAPLLEAGADPTLTDNRGRSALQPERSIAGPPTESCKKSLALLTEAVKGRGVGR